MAIQILPGDQRYAQLGAGFGNLLGGLGQALGAGIGSYAGSRGTLSAADIKAMFPGISDEEAKSYVKLAKSNPQAFSKLASRKLDQRALAEHRARKTGAEASSSPNFYAQEPQSFIDQSYQIPDNQSILNALAGLGGGISVPQMPMQSPRQSQVMPQQSPQQPQAAPYPGFDFEEAVLMGTPIDKALRMEQQERMQREKMRMSQEAPQRNIMAKQMEKLEEEAEGARRRLRDYEIGEKLLKSGEKLNIGKSRRFLEKFGLAEFFDNPTTESLGKIYEDINVLSALSTTTPGKMTAALLERNARRNPSLVNTPEGAQYLLKMRKMADRIIALEANERDKIIENSGGIWPVDLIKRARKAVEPKIEKLHQQMLKDTEAQFGTQRVRDKVTGQIGRIINGQFMPEK